MLSAAALTLAAKVDEAQVEGLLVQEKKIKAALERESDKFFAYMKDFVGQYASGTTPARLSQFTTWAPLTKRWMRHKQLHSKRTRGNDYSKIYYRGTSGKFSSYLTQLSKAGHANKLFGAPITKINIGTGELSADKTIVTKTGRTLTMGYRPDGKYGFITAKKTAPTLTVKIFPNLQGLPSNEVALARWLGEKTGRMDQWMKVFSTSKGRPLRPLVYPLLQWYVKIGLNQALNKVMKT